MSTQALSRRIPVCQTKVRSAFAAPLSMSPRSVGQAAVALILFLSMGLAAFGADVTLFTRAGDPYEIPRPGSGTPYVPLNTSYYVEIKPPSASDLIDVNTIRIQLRQGTTLVREMLGANQTFASGCSGTIYAPQNTRTGVYIDTDMELIPSTTYQTRVYASSMSGATFAAPGYAEWSWTTEASPTTLALTRGMATWMQAPLAEWQGGFFTGVGDTGACSTNAYNHGTWDVLQGFKATGFPNQWTLVRKNLTGLEPEANPFQNSFNVVREQETRRIVSIEASGGNTLLTVEDFFGHEQYGIADHRSVASDYHPGDVISIGDTANFTTATVISATDLSDTMKTLLISPVATPVGGWKIDYSAPLPTSAPPDLPGLFPSGACYLRKHSPPGTPRYYWGRMDMELDTIITEFGNRMIVSMVDAPGDLSFDGRPCTKAKDNAELHQVIFDMTRRMIDRYGSGTLNYFWSIFNEPDLGSYGWRCLDWMALQRHYDYASDAVLRAFEDAGYDSDLVKIGGLELGAISGTNIKVNEFLAHCSPNANSTPGELVLNACYADPRLNGKRSRRVEQLCAANGGKGAPLDFISIHTYNRSEMAASKLKTAKDRALSIDPVYYADLWVNTHESVPTWGGPDNDIAVRDGWLGNGYFPSWCADVVRRQLLQAATDPRYGYGDSIITIWQSPPANFRAYTGVVRAIKIDDDGDGQQDRTINVPYQATHFLNLLSTMDKAFKVYTETSAEGYIASGFGSKNPDDVRVCLYAHNYRDYQSRSDRAFNFQFTLQAAEWPQVRVREFRFDKFSNTYFDLALQLRGRPSRLYSTAEGNAILERSTMRATKDYVVARAAGGSVATTATISANGVSFLIFSDATTPSLTTAGGVWGLY